MNGRQSPLPPIKAAGVPRGSVLGLCCGNAYTDDLLNLVLEAKAFVDDITVSHTFRHGDEAASLSRMNTTHRRVAAPGHKWQVRSVTHKTKLVAVFRSNAAHGEIVRLRNKVKWWGSRTTSR